MSGADVRVVLADLDELGIGAWVDGGWGVDALVGEQTREHHDLDLVLDRASLATVIAFLEERGFVVERNLMPTAVALRHADGRAVDLHPVDPTEDGGGDQLLPDGDRFHYGAPTTGSIDGVAVPCCTMATQVATHLGYAPDEDDVADMRRLAAHFGITLPAPYGEPG